MRAVAGEIEYNGYAEQLTRLFVRENKKNNGKENRSVKTGVGKVQGNKVVQINLSKMRKQLTMKVAFEG